MYNYFLKIALYSTALNIIFTPLNDIIAPIFSYIAIIVFWLYSVLNCIKSNKISIIVIGFVGCILIK